MEVGSLAPIGGGLRPPVALGTPLKVIQNLRMGLVLLALSLLTGIVSPLFAQTPILVEHKLSGDSVCSGKLTCTVTLSSPTVEGDALMLGIAGAGLGGYPISSSPIGDSVWTHCPTAYGTYEDGSNDWIFTDCYYILSREEAQLRFRLHSRGRQPLRLRIWTLRLWRSLVQPPVSPPMTRATIRRARRSVHLHK